MSRRPFVLLAATPWLLGGDCTFGQDGRTTGLAAAVVARGGGPLFAAVIEDSVPFSGHPQERPPQLFVAQIDGCTETRLFTMPAKDGEGGEWIEPEAVIAGPRPFVITSTGGGEDVALGLDRVPLPAVFAAADDMLALGDGYVAQDLAGLRGLSVDGTTRWSYPFPPVTAPGCAPGTPYVRICVAPGGGYVAAVVRSQLAGCDPVLHVHVLDGAGALQRDVPLPVLAGQDGPCAIGDDGTAVATSIEASSAGPSTTHRFLVDATGATRELAPVDGTITQMAVAGSTVAGVIMKGRSCGSDAICYEARAEVWDRDGTVIASRGAGKPREVALMSTGSALTLLYERDYSSAKWNATTWDATGVQLCNADIDFGPYIEPSLTGRQEPKNRN